MPENEDGSLRLFTAPEISAMEIETFRIRDGSHPTETFKWDGRGMTRTFFCKWTERYNFAELVLGNEKLFNHWLDEYHTFAEKRLSRILPDVTYGRHPSYPQIMATRIEEMRGHGAGVDDGDGMPAYSKAEVTVYYEFWPMKIGSPNATPARQEMDRFIRLDGSIRGESEVFGPLPGGSLKATRSGGGGLSGVPMPYSFSITRPVEKFAAVWTKLPYELITDTGALFQRLNFGDPADVSATPFREQRGYRGAVNTHTVEFGSLGRSYPPGTLLLEDVDFTDHVSPLGENELAGKRADASFRFAFAPLGWLSLFVYDPGTPANSGYYTASVDGTYYPPSTFPDNNGLYFCRDLRKLFDVNPP